MKTILPKRSLEVQDRLNYIVQQILHVAKDKIAMIILYGSYARGDWVKDMYTEGHITYSYISDLDFLIVLKKGKFKEHVTLRIESKIEKRLEQAGLRKTKIISLEPSISIICESISEINDKLEKGRYFYTDIKNEGILLYDSGEFQLSRAKDLPWNEIKELAKEDYDQWFERGTGFLSSAVHAHMEINKYAIAAFLLHQATESFYSSILLVFSRHKPKLHDIRKLGGYCANYNAELLKIFPQSSPEQKECFELLEKAYIDARYNKNYRISKEQLLYLIERVEKLKIITEKICLKQINQ